MPENRIKKLMARHFVICIYLYGSNDLSCQLYEFRILILKSETVDSLLGRVVAGSFEICNRGLYIPIIFFLVSVFTFSFSERYRFIYLSNLLCPALCN